MAEVSKDLEQLRKRLLERMEQLPPEFQSLLKNGHLVPTRYWHKLPDGRIQCDVCPRFCKLREGQRGLCFVRARVADQIVLTSYGLASGFCIDPIEKKPLYHYLPGTPSLSFGTAGCNLACKFCQNWDISKARELEKLCERAFPNAIAKAAKHFGCRTVAYTYNDPVIFMEYAIDTAKACAELSIGSVAVTAGYQTMEAAKEFYSYMDAANIDLKAFTERFYYKICGGHLKPVLDTIEYVCNKTEVWVELTTLLIPGENDSEQEIRQLSRWVKEQCGPHVPLHFTAFHPDWKMLDKPPTPPETLIRARQIALDEGLFYVYTGNIHYPEGDSTSCPGCGRLVIGRDWYLLTAWNLTDRGKCKFCGFQIHGVFEEKPGDWGPRRLLVDMSRFAE